MIRLFAIRWKGDKKPDPEFVFETEEEALSYLRNSNTRADIVTLVVLEELLGGTE